ncbi:hypothetical protein [Halobacillus aidingensis]|nr:hypothetical protein [Halobacillus aidingensis]
MVFYIVFNNSASLLNNLFYWIFEAIFEKLAENKTKFIEKTVDQSVEGRDGMIKAGMSEGAVELLDRLEELLENIQNV